MAAAQLSFESPRQQNNDFPYFIDKSVRNPYNHLGNAPQLRILLSGLSPRFI